MKFIKIQTLLFVMFLFFFDSISAQKTFQGSFTMSFETADPEKDPPMLWNIKSDSSGSEMVLQVQDNMLKKGVNKRVLFKPADSTWTMTISFNNVKQGTRIHGAAMYRDTTKHKPVKLTNTSEKKKLEGYTCNKIIVESENYIAELWVTNEIKFDLCKIYRLLSHCGMMSDFVRKGDWFINQKLKTMVLEASSTKKSTSQTYSMRITGISNKIDLSHFDIAGFKIADIPEGQSCGPMIKEEN